MVYSADESREKGRLADAEELYHGALNLGYADKALVFNNLGLVYQTWGRLDDALDLFWKAIERFQSCERKEAIAIAYGNIGIIYAIKGDLDRALEYYDKSLKINKELGRKEGMANQYGSIGNVYLTKGDLDSFSKYVW